MDIALVVDKLLPAAQYTRCATYQELQDSWTDARPIPTAAELAAAEAGCMADQAARDALPRPWEIIEALLALSSDVSLDDVKARIEAAKVAGTEDMR